MSEEKDSVFLIQRDGHKLVFRGWRATCLALSFLLVPIMAVIAIWLLPALLVWMVLK